jgi:hypothetical protein
MTRSRCLAPVGALPRFKVRALALRSDGKIVVAANVGAKGSFDRPALARYTSGGERDEAFSGDGHVVVTAVGESEVPDDGLLLSRGRVVIVAQRGFGTEVIRYLGSGRIDMAFGDGGTASVAIGSPEAIVGTTNGRFVVGGGETDRCGYGMPLVSFDGVKEPDVRVSGRASLRGRRLRLRLRGPEGRQLVSGKATAIAERPADAAEPTQYGRPCADWDKVGAERFRLRRKGSAVIELGRRDAAHLRRKGNIVVRVTSRASGREGATTRRVRVVFG